MSIISMHNVLIKWINFLADTKVKGHLKNVCRKCVLMRDLKLKYTFTS